MTNYAVIGASRGIGLEFVEQLAACPDAMVFAIVRSMENSKHLIAAQIENVYVVEADVVDYAALERAANRVAEISGGKLDVLIHNAAKMGGSQTWGYDSFPDMDALDADFIEAFKINTLGVIHSISAFLPLLRASQAPTKKIAVISSPAADPHFSIKMSMADRTAYGMTKAATNMAVTKWAVKLKSEGFIVVALSPGFVDTSPTRTDEIGAAAVEEIRNMFTRFEDMMKAKGIFMVRQTPTQSVAAQLKVIDELTMEQTGLFLNHEGKEWESL